MMHTRAGSIVARLVLLALLPASCARHDGDRPRAAPPSAPSPPAALAARFPGTSPSLAVESEGVVRAVYVVPLTEKSKQIQVRTLSPQLGEASAVGEPLNLMAHGEVGPVLTASSERGLVMAYAVASPAGGWNSDLFSRRSIDGGTTWASPIPVQDERRTASHSYADLVSAADGVPVLSWLDDRTGHQGVQAARLMEGEGGASRRVDDFTCECCRTSLLRTHTGELWLAYRDHGDGDVRNVSYAVSSDDGRTFVRRGAIADDHWVLRGCPDSGPRLTEDADGVVWAAWFNGAENAIEVAAAHRGAFGPPAVVARVAGDVTTVNHPEIGSLPDGRLVLFYEAGVGEGPTILMLRSDLQRSIWSAPVRVGEGGSGPRYVRGTGLGVLVFSAREGERRMVAAYDSLALGLLAEGKDVAVQSHQ